MFLNVASIHRLRASILFFKSALTLPLTLFLFHLACPQSASAAAAPVEPRQLLALKALMDAIEVEVLTFTQRQRERYTTLHDEACALEVCRYACACALYLFFICVECVNEEGVLGVRL